MRESLKTAIAWLGCAYGLLASSYLLIWHVSILFGYDGRFDPENFSPNAWLIAASTHGFFLLILLLDREISEFRWPPLVAATEDFVSHSRNLLGMLFWYVVLFVVGSVLDSIHVVITLKASFFELGLTAILLLQTAYVGLCFLISREKLWDKDLNLMQYILRCVRIVRRKLFW